MVVVLLPLFLLFIFWMSPSMSSIAILIRLRSAALICALLNSILFKVVGEVRNAAYKVTVVVSLIGALRNQVRDGAAIGKQHVLHPRVTAVDDNCWA